MSVILREKKIASLRSLNSSTSLSLSLSLCWSPSVSLLSLSFSHTHPRRSQQVVPQPTSRRPPCRTADADVNSLLLLLGFLWADFGGYGGGRKFLFKLPWPTKLLLEQIYLLQSGLIFAILSHAMLCSS